MAYKTLLFGVDAIFDELKPYYDRAIRQGLLEIVAYAVINPNGDIRFVTPDGKPSDGEYDSVDVDIVIVSAHINFYRRVKFLESQSFPRNRIIDGRIFLVPNLDFPRFMAEGVAHGTLDKNSFAVLSHVGYPQVYSFADFYTSLTLGTKSFINNNAAIKGNGSVSVGKISSLAEDIIFSLGQNKSHNYRNVGTIPWSTVDWEFPDEFLPQWGACKILIGNDVWIGRGSILKCTNPDKPLVIGDGAVVASDSVVVKNVPPYAIVGGNPAQIIKYRFAPDVIESLLQIKWWDWSWDKIHDNFKYFNDVEKFIALHSK